MCSLNLAAFHFMSWSFEYLSNGFSLKLILYCKMWEVPDIYRNKKDKVVKPSDRFDKHKRDPKTLLVAPKRNIKPLPIGYRGADLVDSNSKGIYDDSGANTLIGDGLGNDSVFAISIDSFDQAFAKSPTDTYRKSHPKKGIIPSPLRKGSPGSKCSARSRSQSPSDVRSGNALQPGIVLLNFCFSFKYTIENRNNELFSPCFRWQGLF